MVYKPIFMAWVDIKVADCEVAVALDEVMLSLSTASIALFFNVFFSFFLALAGTIGCTPSSVASVGVGEGAEPTLGGKLLNTEMIFKRTKTKTAKESLSSVKMQTQEKWRMIEIQSPGHIGSEAMNGARIGRLTQ